MESTGKRNAHVGHVLLLYNVKVSNEKADSFVSLLFLICSGKLVLKLPLILEKYRLHIRLRLVTKMQYMMSLRINTGSAWPLLHQITRSR